MTGKPAAFEISADTRLVLQRLREVTVGELVTYRELGAAISKDLSGASGCLHRAREKLVRNEQIVFSVVRNVGLRRLNDRDIVAATAGDVGAIRRHAKRAVRKVTSISDFAALPSADQLRHTAALSIFAAVAEVSSEKGLKRVEKAAQGRSGELPIAQTLSAFGARP